MMPFDGLDNAPYPATPEKVETAEESLARGVRSMQRAVLAALIIGLLVFGGLLYATFRYLESRQGAGLSGLCGDDPACFTVN